MDGWDTIEEINKRGFGKDVVVSILTAKGTPEHDKLQVVAPYIHDYITKPFDVKGLISNVHQMVAM